MQENILQGIGYQKHCNEFTVTRCRTVFDTSSEERCWTVYKKQCDMIYETVVDYEYEQKCSTSYEEECHGYGYHQECEKVGIESLSNETRIIITSSSLELSLFKSSISQLQPKFKPENRKHQFNVST